MSDKKSPEFNNSSAPHVGQISESLPTKHSKDYGKISPDGKPWRRVFKSLEDAKKNSYAFAHLRND